MTKSLKLLKERISAKRYVENIRLSKSEKEELLESIRFAPSSFGMEPFRVILIENKTIREELKASWWNQLGLTQSSALLIWIGFNEKYLQSVHFQEQVKRNIPEEFIEIQGMMVNGANNILEALDITRQEWVSRQAYISLGTVLNTAQELNLDVCPSEGFNAKSVSEILAKHHLINLDVEKVLVGMFVGKVDTNQPFHHAFTKMRKPIEKAYKIIE